MNRAQIETLIHRLDTIGNAYNLDEAPPQYNQEAASAWTCGFASGCAAAVAHLNLVLKNMPEESNER